jgi:hypothetical protein
MWQRDSGVSLVIRTDFVHELEWAAIQSAIIEPQTEDGFSADVQFVDDRAYDGLTQAQLLATVPHDAPATVVFLVDTLTLTHPDRPVQVINLYAGDGLGREGAGYGATFRVVPSEIWSVQNNLSLANMDWEDFGDEVDEEGVFRGFQ